MNRAWQSHAVSAALLGTFLLAFALIPGASSAQEEDPVGSGEGYAADELIVTFKDENVSDRVVTSLGGEMDAKVKQLTPASGVQLFELPAVKSDQKLAQIKKNLERNPRVAAAEYNYFVEPRSTPNDEFFPRQYNLRKIQAPEAQDITAGEGVKLGIVDSGIQSDHPDLGGKVVAQRDFTGSEEDPEAEDNGGHGTIVGGVAAANTDNRKGVAGTCPDCKLVVAKFANFGDGSGEGGTVADSIEAIDYAASQGAEVINLSYGRPTNDDTPDPPLAAERRVINNAHEEGAVLVGAVDNARTGSENDFPSAYEHVIAVAATNRDDQQVSNFGDHVDIAAPGVSIPSTFINDQYVLANGTSFATPQVAGVAGLLSGEGLSNEQIQKRIECSARDLGQPGRDDLYGEGLVNAFAAVTRGCPAPDLPQPPELPGPPDSPRPPESPRVPSTP